MPVDRLDAARDSLDGHARMTAVANSFVSATPDPRAPPPDDRLLIR